MECYTEAMLHAELRRAWRRERLRRVGIRVGLGLLRLVAPSGACALPATCFEADSR